MVVLKIIVDKLKKKLLVNSLNKLLLGRKAMANLDSVKKQRHHFANKSLYSLSYDFPSSHACMDVRVGP